MRKQIITLAICLALSSTYTLAQESGNTEKTVPQAKAFELTRKEQTRKCFKEKMSKKRENLYKTLGLSVEQREKVKELRKKNRGKAKPLINNLHQQKIKLYELKTQKASKIEICKQKHKVNLAQKALRDYFREVDKSFKAILTEEQLLKFRKIKEQRRDEIRKRYPYSRKGFPNKPMKQPFNQDCPTCKVK